MTCLSPAEVLTMNPWWLVSHVALWLVVLFLGFLLLGAPLSQRRLPAGQQRHTDNVLRYDESSDAFVDAFVLTNSGGLRRTTAGLETRLGEDKEE
jgi:hypothetical protein